MSFDLHDDQAADNDVALRLSGLFNDIRAAFLVAPPVDVAEAHLRRMAETGSHLSRSRKQRRWIVLCGVAGATMATGGLASAGALPAPMQKAVAAAVKPIGVHLPTGDTGPSGDGGTADPPGLGGDNPGAVSDPPGHGGDNPGGSDLAPGRAKAPGNSENAPGHGGVNPGGSASAPGLGGDNPGAKPDVAPGPGGNGQGVDPGQGGAPSTMPSPSSTVPTPSTTANPGKPGGVGGGSGGAGSGGSSGGRAGK